LNQPQPPLEACDPPVEPKPPRDTVEIEEPEVPDEWPPQYDPEEYPDDEPHDEKKLLLPLPLLLEPDPCGHV
jgi:hypothetical protein